MKKNAKDKSFDFNLQPIDLLVHSETRVILEGNMKYHIYTSQHVRTQNAGKMITFTIPFFHAILEIKRLVLMFSRS